MYDFNYFRPYQKVKARTNWSRLIAFLVILVTLALVALDAFHLVLQLKIVGGEVAGMEARLSDPQKMEGVKELDLAQKELKGLRADALTLEAMKAFTAHESVFGYERLKAISDRLSEDSYLESIHYSGRHLSLRGTTEKEALTRIAQFVYRLRSSKEFGGFNINLVSRPILGQEDLYSFELGFFPLEQSGGNGS